ncbi:MAG TPA: hypothetical protein VIL86_09825, partial [Tepidisphaeraceae bacterium]
MFWKIRKAADSAAPTAAPAAALGPAASRAQAAALATGTAGAGWSLAMRLTAWAALSAFMVVLIATLL